MIIDKILNIVVLLFKMSFIAIGTLILLIIHFVVCIICNPIISLINFGLNREIPYIDICKTFGGR